MHDHSLRFQAGMRHVRVASIGQSMSHSKIVHQTSPSRSISTGYGYKRPKLALSIILFAAPSSRSMMGSQHYTHHCNLARLFIQRSFMGCRERLMLCCGCIMVVKVNHRGKISLHSRSRSDLQGHYSVLSPVPSMVLVRGRTT